MKARFRNIISVIIIFLIVAEFFIDSQTPLGFSDWMSYIVPILLTGWIQKPWTKVVTGIISVLTVIGIFLSPHNPTYWVGMSIINRTIGIMVFWITAGLVILRKNALEKLQLAHIELEKGAKKILEAEKLKTEFIADTSHELRTPLAIIKSYIDLALGKKSQNMTNPRRALKEIDKEIGHISQIVSDLTTLARSDSNFSYTLKLGTFSLADLIIRVINKNRILAKNKNITVSVKISSPLNYKGDEEKIEKLFTNLLTNAIQYGREDGWINVSVSKQDSWAVIEVKDNGIGIPEKYLNHVFERFFRIEKARTRDTGGVGLGLAICKWIAESHGGTISVSSKDNEGSVFSVKLPIRT